MAERTELLIAIVARSNAPITADAARLPSAA
jgi:hypothetical protein